MSNSRDENLLFGVLALQLDFITQEQLVAAANAWMVSKSSGLGEILIQLGALTTEDYEFVKLIVQKHVAKSGSPKSSLEKLKQHEASEAESKVQTILHGGTIEELDGERIRHDATTIWTGPENGGDSRFLRLRELATGGLGVVSVARDQQLEREVALKEMLQPKRLSQDALERFVAEAKITGNLEHPGIVPIYGLGTTADGSPYYAMRLIRGRSLHEEIEELQGTKRRSNVKQNYSELDAGHLRKLLRSLTMACNAVAYAHSRGVIHRDLKPSNVMLGKFGETIVVDWGLAKVIGDGEQSQMRSEPPMRDSRDSHDSATVMGAVMGTPAYMSPEQAEGRIDLVDRRSDVFGLGACLYSLLTNLPPFKGTSKAESLANARSYRLKPLRAIDKSIPAALEAICMKAMDSDPNKRYQQATELADDLDRWIAGEAVTAMRDPLVQRAFRWARRHQKLVTGTAVLVLTALGALSVGSYLVREQRNIARLERDRANDAATEAKLQRDKADQALVKAQESNAVSLAVLEKFVDGLGDDGWAAVPIMESKRIEMVDLAVNRFRKLHAENPDDLVIKARLVRILVRSANLYRMVGRLEKASKHFDGAMTLLDSLSSNAQLNDVGLALMGDSLFAYANLVEEQQGAVAAMASCQQGVDVCRKRLLLKPAEPMAKLALAMALAQSASLQLDNAEFAAALAAAKESQETLHQLASTPLSQQFFYSLFDIIAFDHQVKSLLKQGLESDAERVLEDAKSVSESAIAQYPADNNIEYFAIQLQRDAAKLLYARKQFTDGNKVLLRCLERTKRLAEKHPETVEYQRSIKALLGELGTQSLLLDAIAEAKVYAALAMDGVDISELRDDAPIGELKPYAHLLALAVALARREGEENDPETTALLAKLQMICGRLKSAAPKIETLEMVARVTPDVLEQ